MLIHINTLRKSNTGNCIGVAQRVIDWHVIDKREPFQYFIFSENEQRQSWK